MPEEPTYVDLWDRILAIQGGYSDLSHEDDRIENVLEALLYKLAVEKGEL